MWSSDPASRVDDAPRPSRVDYADLAESLAALSFPPRLELLDVLRFPHTAAEIRLAPHRTGPGENPDRAVSKQAVMGHIEKLVDAGLVRVEHVVIDGRPTHRYVINAARFFAVTEELRRLNLRFAGRGAGGDETGTLGSMGATEDIHGPRLVLVHGVYEGKAYSLTPERAVDGRWLIGRQRGAAIALDYDPFVSLEHAYIAREGNGYVLADVAESKNGTHVNWRVLPKGGAKSLKPGDVVGVGCSLLTFIPD